jgi:hypothetical protein
MKPTPQHEPDTYEAVLAQHLWHNRHITQNNKPIAWHEWVPDNELAYFTIDDIWDKENKTWVTVDSVSFYLGMKAAMRLPELTDCIPPAWITLLNIGPFKVTTGDWVAKVDENNIISDVGLVTHTIAAAQLCTVEWREPLNTKHIVAVEHAVTPSTLTKANIVSHAFHSLSTQLAFNPASTGWHVDEHTFISTCQYTVKLGHALGTTVHNAASTSTIQKVWSARYPDHLFHWEMVWARLKTIPNGKWKALQWRVLHAPNSLAFICTPADCPHCNKAVKPIHLIWECPLATSVWGWVQALWHGLHNTWLVIDTPHILTGLQHPDVIPIHLRSAWTLLHGLTYYTLWCEWCRHVHDNIELKSNNIIKALYNKLCTLVVLQGQQALIKDHASTLSILRGASPPSTTNNSQSTNQARFNRQWINFASLDAEIRRYVVVRECHQAPAHTYTHTAKLQWRHRKMQPQYWLHLHRIAQTPDVHQPQYRLHVKSDALSV